MILFTSFLPREVYFPGLVSPAPGAVGNGPIKDAQTIYFNAFKSIGDKPDVAYNLPWDPIMMLVEALRKLGPNATGRQIHDYLVNLHGWVGINGVYDFRDGSQRGIGQITCVIDTYDAAKDKIVAVSRPGGYLK